MTYIPQSTPKLTVMHEGRKWYLVDLARSYGVPYERVRMRYHMGARGSDLVKPVRPAMKPANRQSWKPAVI